MTETLKAVLLNLPLLTVTVGIQYRFAHKTLGIKFSEVITFLTMVLVSLFAGWMNMEFHLAGNMGNTIYYMFVNFGLYLCFFKGKTVKKLFFSVLINCGIPIAYYIFIPFVCCFLGQTDAQFLPALKILEYVNILLSVMLMEYVGKEFQNLRRDLPAGYTVYLTAVVLFIYVAIYSKYDIILIENEGMISLPVAFMTSAFAVAGMVIVIAAIFAVDRQVDISLKAQLQMMQAENFKTRELEWRRLSSFRHDIKNHLLTLNYLIEKGKTEQAASYMCKLTDAIRQFDSPVQTGNDYADALLSAKYAEAVEENIKITLEMAIPSQGFIEPVDLCCILSNAFDNAIAACKRMTEGEKWIFASAYIKQGQFVVVIKNSRPSDVTVTDGEVFPKEITADHGLGLDTVRTVVEKYGGVLTLSANDEFSFSALLPPCRLRHRAGRL